MRTLILDIETVGEDWSGIDEVTQDKLLGWIERSTQDKKEQAALAENVKARLGLSPLTGSIVALGLCDLERKEGIVYYQSDKERKEEEIDGYALRIRSEKELLEDFWEGAKEYDMFVTFNGRRFDIPYILLRSAILGVRPTQDLMKGRYLYQQGMVRHIDLQDQLTFYGAMQKRPSLHLFTRAFGIDSPKADGISGEDVAELFRMKKFRDIAIYNSKDVTATAELYKKWFDYLAPEDFEMIIE